MSSERRNLIISAVGDKSLHESWLSDDRNYDIFLLYYGSDEGIFDRYKSQCEMAWRAKGEKGLLYHKFASENLEDLKKYDRIWQPDDDIQASPEEIKSIFSIHEKYGLWLSQPAVEGFVSHPICLKVESSVLRYTNFVEIMCPVFSIAQFVQLYHTWILNFSSWGLDYLWPKMLGYPKDKIAIIDAVTVRHRNPVGSGRNRYPRNPHLELQDMLKEYKISPSQTVYSRVSA